jgi:hypothetical protein
MIEAAPERARRPLKKKRAPDHAVGALRITGKRSILLDLRFLEFDVLPGDRVVLGLRHLFRHRTAVLGRDVEETRVGCRKQLDLDGSGFCHGRPAFVTMKAVDNRLRATGKVGAKLQIAAEKSRPFWIQNDPDH